jgi:hypothetical protein
MPLGLALRRRRTAEPDAGALAAAIVLDPAGAPVCLGALWRERPAVLVLLRHFG